MCRVAWHINCSLRRLTYVLDSLSMTVTALLKYVIVNTMCETLDLRISCAFDGNLHALPRLRVCSQCYIPPQFLRCNSGRIVFIANVPNEIRGGHIEHGNPIAELLCIF